METYETSVSTSLGVRMASSSENDKRVAAFLALIRYAEFNKHVPADAYQELYGGRSFANLSTHPNIKVTRWGHSFTSAGAYQINKKTYDDAVKHEIAFDFQKQSQDAIAIWEIQRKGALPLIWDGQLDGAFLALHKIWSSLPGGG